MDMIGFYAFVGELHKGERYDFFYLNVLTQLLSQKRLIISK